jgi:RHS repeat-associated protein
MKPQCRPLVGKLARPVLAILLALLQVLSCLPYPAVAREQDRTRSASTVFPAPPKNVSVNRTVPRVDPLPSSPKFSLFPSDEQITQARIFGSPLLQTDESRTGMGMFGALSNRVPENRALARALLSYSKGGNSEDVASLAGFLDRHPQSRWRAGLLANLGTVYRQTGRFTKALEAFEEVWRLTKGGTGQNARTLANWAGGELAEMYGHLGRSERLTSLFGEIEDRPLYGPAAEQVGAARELLSRKQQDPEGAARCGPMALARIRQLQGLPPDPNIDNASATPEGMSLARLAELAAQSGMNLRIAKREPGATIPTPAVAHWKVDHYSAIVDRKEINGREYYRVENPLFEREMWVSRAALDEETDGYFLVPEGELARGWRPVSSTEAEGIWGRCFNGIVDRERITYYDAKVYDEILCETCSPTSCPAVPPPMARHDVHAMLVSLNIEDAPVGYTPPRGPPARFIATYNQREMFQPAGGFQFSNLGWKWTFNWLSYVTDRGPITGPLDRGAVTVYLRGGGQEDYYINERIHFMSQAEVVLASVRPDVYERRLPDGSKEVFGMRAGIRVFLTQIVDPAGNALRFTYDSNLRLVAATDAIGQVTTLSYELPSDPYKVTRVTDPFGRSATFSYDTSGHLIRITDVLGLTSEFTYADGVDGDFITSLKTPYGLTTFRTGRGPSLNTYLEQSNRWLEITDPLGETERIEFRGTLPDTDRPPSDTTGATYYWDKRAWKQAPGDVRSARRWEWILIAAHTATGLTRFFKNPLESRLSYKYPGQLNEQTLVGKPQGNAGVPNAITRTLEGGVTQAYQFQHNERGNVTRFTDPAGRQFSYRYASNQVDVLEIQNDKANEVVARFTYNSQHEPLTYTDGANQSTSFTYNPQGQVLSVTNAQRDTTNFVYDVRGYLTTIMGPVAGAVSRFTYDGFGRVRTVTDSEGYVLTFEYDSADRLIGTIYPDGTFVQIAYDRLDPVYIKDRQGRETTVVYDALRRPTAVTDPLRRTTQMVWCNCGGLEQLIDPAGNVTTWTRDLQGRVTRKTLADETSTRYLYDNNTGRLKQMIDAKGQVIDYGYTLDDNLDWIRYSNTAVPTPDVRFAYDANYDRIASIQDGIGITTYTYNPAGSLGALQPAAVTGPLENSSVAYSYDELGRSIGRTVNGASSSWVYDALGRVIREANPLGTFIPTYVGTTARLSTLTYPNGQKTLLDYFDNGGDQRLRQIKHQAPNGGLLSQFDYAYAPAGEILSMVRQQPYIAAAPSAYAFNYDAASQLTGAVLGTADSTIAAFGYMYDAAGNRTVEQINELSRYGLFNKTNQLAWQVQGESAALFIYDLNGNLIDDGTRRFEWDALDRLTAIVMGNRRSEFSYDGLSRRTRIVEKENDLVVSDKQLVWCGNEICEERTAAGATRRFLPQGETEVVDGTDIPYFYTRDHLGSVRELTDSSGNPVAVYDYDPYGRPIRVGGAKDATFGYAGYYVHSPSGLNLMQYRAYDPNLGRWLSRDPIAEDGGLNLYLYVLNNPINVVDPDGRKGFPWDKVAEGFQQPLARFHVQCAIPHRRDELIAEFRSSEDHLKAVNTGWKRALEERKLSGAERSKLWDCVLRQRQATAQQQLEISRELWDLYFQYQQYQGEAGPGVPDVSTVFNNDAAAIMELSGPGGRWKQFYKKGP